VVNGIYCLDVTTAEAPRNVVATLDAASGDGDQIQASTRSDVVGTNCAGIAGSDVLVETTSANGVGALRSFYIIAN
jgi:hypothetical protein